MALAANKPIKDRSIDIIDGPLRTEHDRPLVCDNGADSAHGAPRGEDTDSAGLIDSRQAEVPQAAVSGISSHTEGEEFPNHARTAAIDIPSASSASQDASGVFSDRDHSIPEPRTFESPFVEEFLRNRRPSITFHPEVKLESGHRRKLEEPLPKLDTLQKSGRESILTELHDPAPSRPLLRAYSEANCRDFDRSTGEPLGSISNHHPSFRARSPENRSRYLIPQPKPHDIFSSPNAETDLEQGTSLTSDSTASPHIPEARTPTDPPMDVIISPIISFPTLNPASFDEASSWSNKARRQFSAFNRTSSFNLERKSSIRTTTRKSSRRSTSSSISPATAFLSRFAREELAPEPDDEGQEIGDYILGRQIGFGGFSIVREAYTLEGDERIVRAVKIVRRQVLNKAEPENELVQQQFEHEVALWRCLANRYLLPLFDVQVTPFATFCFTKLNFGGTLFDVVKANRKGLDQDLARRYTYQLASGIRYLHEDMRIVHRDIKLENCLIDLSNPETAANGGTLMLCDFGLAQFYTSDHRRPHRSPSSESASPSTSPTLHSPLHNAPLPAPSTATESGPSPIAGSLQYASPETLMSPSGVVSPAADIWALGVVIYALLAGDLPFQHMFQPRVQMMILAGEWDESALFAKKRQDSNPESVENEEIGEETMVMEAAAIELVKACLNMDSLERWSISKVLGCRWLWGVQEAVEEVGPGWKL